MQNTRVYGKILIYAFSELENFFTLHVIKNRFPLSQTTVGLRWRERMKTEIKQWHEFDKGRKKYKRMNDCMERADQKEKLLKRLMECIMLIKCNFCSASEMKIGRYFFHNI